MKKLYVQFIAALVSHGRGGRKAVNLFILAFALSSMSYSAWSQVVVTAGSGGTNICSNAALGGTAPACATLGPITIIETSNGDFPIAASQIILSAPAGWQFCTATTPTQTHLAGDLSSVTLTITSGTLKIDFSSTGTSLHDAVTISGLQVQALSPSSSAGSIYASSVSGVVGVILGPGAGSTDFGDLALIPTPITGPSSVCVGACTSSPLVSTPGGGVWSTSSGAIATVGPTGIVCGVGPGSATITYTVSGCSISTTINVSSNPPSITGLLPAGGPYHMCAWYDTLTISDGATNGVYNSSLVTVDNFAGTGTGKVRAHAPGTATIVYTLPSGCSTSATVIIDPLPSGIQSPPYVVCQGSSKLLTSTPTTGTWSSVTPAIGTIDPTTGLFQGLNPGSTLIIYKIPGGFGSGCITDTTMLVNPVPFPIVPVGGTAEICSLGTTRLAEATVGGTWSSITGSVATVTPITVAPDTAVVTGVGVGTSVISYTLATGCAATIIVTVDPLPGSITGPHAVCVNDSVQLFNSSPGGHWSVSNPLKATIDSNTGYILGIDSGVVTVTYTIMPGSCIATYLVTINPLPKPIYGPDSVCVSSTIPLGDSTAGGTWSVSVVPPISAIDGTGLLTGGPGSGVETVHYTLPTGCRVSYNVTVNPLPSPIVGLDSICRGDTILLTDFTSTGGVWASSSFILLVSSSYPDSARVVGNAVGVGTISFTSPSGCTVTKNITVNPTPSAIYSDTAVCQFHSVTLYDSVAGGTWSCLNTSIADIGSSSGIVTGISTGTTVISYVTAGGCRTGIIFQVYDFAEITGPTHFCLGDSILLKETVNGGYWTSSDTTIAKVPGGVDSTFVIGIRPGVVTITYTMPHGCVASYVVTVDSVAAITSTGPARVCVGSSIVLSDPLVGGIWSSGGTGIATVVAGTPPNIGIVTGVGAGSVYIYYTMPTGCINAILVTVDPLPGPIYGRDSVCVGDTIIMTDSIPGLGGTWSMTNGNATINPIDGTVTGVGAGLDTVVYTLGSGCFITKAIKINPLSHIYGPDSVCVGQQILLGDTTAGALGTWSVLHSGVYDKIIGVAGFTAVDSGISAGVDTVVYSIAATGCVTTHIVTINPLPVITGKHAVCEGDTIHLSGMQPGGTWTRANTHAGVVYLDDSTSIVSGLTTGVDTIYYTLPTTCATMYIVTVNHTPSVIIGHTYICLGRTDSLSDGTGGGYWTSLDTNIVKIDSFTGKMYGDSLGVTVIRYTLPTGNCSAATHVTVEAIPAITVIHSHPTMICKGGSDTLDASGSVTGVSYTYTWAPSFGLSATTGARVVASPTLTTTYTVTGTSQWGCDSFTLVTVLVDDTLLGIKVVGRDSICRGQCDTLMASGRAGTYFNWHPATSLSCTICDTTIACPDVTTTYVAVAIDDLGCKDSVVFKVTVNPLPIINVTPNPAILCYGTPLQLHASTTNTDSNTTHFAWSPNIFISSDSVKNPIINDTSNLVYRVIATTIYGCFDSFKVKVSVLDTNVNTISLDTNICLGGSAQLEAISHSVNSNLNVPTYFWYPATGLNNNQIWDPVATPSVTTTYYVKIHENACFDTTLSVTVFVQPYPILDINPKSQTIIAGTPVQEVVTVENTPVLYYAWAPSGTLSCDSCLNPVAIPTVNTTYTVTVSSIYHCITQDTVTIHMLCDNSQIFIPNTFTPNGDGVNDRFFVSGKGITLITLFQVYSRWGQLVYEAHNVPANDPAYGWDGTFKGLVLEPDVFVYIVHAKCELGGDDFKYKGDISLVR